MTDKAARLAGLLLIAALAGVAAGVLARTGRPPRQPAPVLPLDGAGLMLVEDDEDTREALSALLQLEGAAVTAAVSTKAALALLDATSRRPHAVVLDVDLPGQDGEVFVQRLRVVEARRGWQRIPVLALTGCSGSGQRQRLLAAGFQAQLTKPTPVAELLQQLRQACGLAARWS